MGINRNNFGTKPTIGIVSFDAYIGMYAETLRYVSWKLQKLGFNVIRVGCDGALGACTSMNSLGKNITDSSIRRAVCKKCKKAQSNIASIAIKNVNDRAEEINQDAIDFIKDVEIKLKEHSMALPVLDMHYLQLPLCKIAFFDFAILLKVAPNSHLSEVSISRFLHGLKDLIMLQKHLESLLEHSHLTHVIYINGNYSLNTLVRMLCEAKNIKSLSIEPQLTSQHILNYIILKRNRLELSPDGLLSVSPEIKIDPRNLSNVINSFGARITGGDFNAYTTLSDFCDEGERSKYKIFFEKYSRVHSFFMSSEDELVPHIVSHDFLNENDQVSSSAYKSQFEFTRFYLAEAAKSPEIGFVIRLHPRMAINKRDMFESAEHVRYKVLINQTALSHNVLIILGDSRISSYFILKKSSLVTVSWSTIGLEALMMGIPVVSAFPNNLMYPLKRFSKQPENFEQMKKALFADSDYGVADDMKLLNWVSMAYEGQFFATLAPRGQGGRLGRVYNLIYRIVDRLGAYSLYASIVDKMWIRTPIFSDQLILDRQQKEESSNLQASKKLINSYRNRVNRRLKQYENKLFEFSPY